MNTDDHLLRITGIIESIAGRAVVHIDDLTLGYHPDPDQREAGEMALCDHAQNGGPVVSEGDDAVLELVRRTSPARALGAALLAAFNAGAAVAEHLPLEGTLAELADIAAWDADGGPADRCLRLALCARRIAFDMLGAPGTAIPELDSYGRERTPPRDYQRPEARLPVDRCDFWRLDAVAHLPLAPADRALIGAP